MKKLLPIRSKVYMDEYIGRIEKYIIEHLIEEDKIVHKIYYKVKWEDGYIEKYETNTFDENGVG